MLPTPILPVTMTSLEDRAASLEEDLYTPDVEFADHQGGAERMMRDILVSERAEGFQRFSRIASAQEMEDFDSFYESTEEGHEYPLSPDSGVCDLSQMDPESRAKAEEEWTRELAKVEEEINTLRSVLSSKVRRMQELKRKLGITVWKEFQQDMEQGIKNIQESTAYQKTSQTLKTATERTTGVLGTWGATVRDKLSEVKQSPAFKNLEDKVGSAYTNVKTKVVGTPSTNGNRTEELINEKSNEN